MTEGNFVDYIKIHVNSGKGGKGSTHLRREKAVAKGGEMAVTVVVEDTSLSVVTKITGRFFILNLSNTSEQHMAVMVVNKPVLVMMVKMQLLKFP